MVAEGPGNNGDGSSEIMGYVLGKAEGEGKLWHGHVSAVTVAPSYRRLGLAKTLMDDFEDLCVNTYDAYFVDLFVRETNRLAQEMYEKFGYSICKSYENLCETLPIVSCEIDDSGAAFSIRLPDFLIFLVSTKRIVIASFTNTVDRRVLEYYSGDSPEDAFDM